MAARNRYPAVCDRSNNLMWLVSSHEVDYTAGEHSKDWPTSVCRMRCPYSGLYVNSAVRFPRWCLTCFEPSNPFEPKKQRSWWARAPGNGTTCFRVWVRSISVQNHDYRRKFPVEATNLVFKIGLCLEKVGIIAWQHDSRASRGASTVEVASSNFERSNRLREDTYRAHIHKPRIASTRYK